MLRGTDDDERNPATGAVITLDRYSHAIRTMQLEPSGRTQPLSLCPNR